MQIETWGKIKKSLLKKKESENFIDKQFRWGAVEIFKAKQWGIEHEKISGHKIGGPVGAGALLLRREVLRRTALPRRVRALALGEQPLGQPPRHEHRKRTEHAGQRGSRQPAARDRVGSAGLAGQSHG